jgi:hypothetical protein
MNERDKEASIAHILDAGLVKPQTTRAYIRELCRQLGLRYIFWDAAQLLALAAVTMAVALLLLAQAPQESRYSLLFATSPLVFLLTLALSQWLEHASGLYELKATCRYDIRHVAAVRTMGFALLGLLFSTASGLLLGSAGQLLPMLSLAMAALFINAAASLFLLMHAPRRLAPVAIALWAAIAIAPMLLQPAAWEDFLANLPTALTLAVALVAAALSALQFTRLLKTPVYKEPAHAAS